MEADLLDRLQADPDRVLEEFHGRRELPSATSVPVQYAAQAASNQQSSQLRAAVLSHFPIFSDAGVLPFVISWASERPRDLDALELLAFVKFEHALPADPQLLADLDMHTWTLLRERSADSTAAGYAPVAAFSTKRVKSSGEGFFSRKPWLMQLLIEGPLEREFVGRWWPLVVPALLNFLDTSNTRAKRRGVALVDALASRHAEKLASSGLAPVFASGVEPCLSLLPPLSSPQETQDVHRPALLCLARLAQCEESVTERMHFLAKDGLLKPFLHSENRADLLLYFMTSLRIFVDTHLRSLTVAHLHGFVQVFSDVLADPFVGAAPDVVTATLEALETVLAWSWARMDTYRFDLLYGLAKAEAFDSKAFRMLAGNDAQEIKEAAMAGSVDAS